MKTARRACIVLVAGTIVAGIPAAWAKQEKRKDLLLVLPPPARGNFSGKIIVHGGGEWDGIRERALGPRPAEVPPLGYGDAVVAVGDKRTRVGPGKRLVFEIPAHPSQLQRLTIDGLAVLVGVVPGEVMTLQSGPCALWRLSSNRLDPSQASPPGVYCANVGDTCRPGFVEVTGNRFRDPLCRGVVGPGARTKRCMVPGAVRVVSDHDVRIAVKDGNGEEEKAWNARSGELSAYVAASDGTCGLWELAVGEESFLLVIGPGEKWTLKAGAGGSMSGVRE